jgi:hypothetical protein
MTTRTPSAGDIIDAYCTSCRTVMNHTIVSLVATRPARVQCNTCHGVHNYRKEKASADKAKVPSEKRTATNTRKSPVDAAHREWVAMQVSRKNGEVSNYDMKASYQVGDLVNHPKFGLGVVRQLVGPNKIEIVFEEGAKLLRCG